MKDGHNQVKTTGLHGYRCPSMHCVGAHSSGRRQRHKDSRLELQKEEKLYRQRSQIRGTVYTEAIQNTETWPANIWRNDEEWRTEQPEQESVQQSEKTPLHVEILLVSFFEHHTVTFPHYVTAQGASGSGSAPQTCSRTLQVTVTVRWMSHLSAHVTSRLQLLVLF